MATTPTQIRLTDDDKDKLRAIMERNGLPSLASAVRWAIVMACASTGITHSKKTRRKNQKLAGEALDTVATGDILQ